MGSHLSLLIMILFCLLGLVPLLAASPYSYSYSSISGTNYGYRNPTNYGYRNPTNFGYRNPTNFGYRNPTNYRYGNPTNYGYRYPTKYPTNTFRMRVQGQGLSTDIIAQTRSLADSVKSTLRSLAADPDSSIIINKIIRDKDNVCLNSLEEGLAGIETATQLVEDAGDDIKSLISKVERFTKLKDPATVVKEVAAILRILEPLVKNIAPSNPEICQATPAEAFGSLRSLAVLVDSLASTHQLNLSNEGRNLLKKSGSTIYAVTTFLTQLRETFSRFEEICTPDKEYNFEAISAIGDLMIHLADLAGSLGGVETGENIRKGKVFTERILAQLNKIDNLDLGMLDCSRPGDFSVASQTLEELADIIEEIGVESLQKQLGVNLDFVFL